MAGRSNLLEDVDISGIGSYCSENKIDLYEYPIVRGLPLYHQQIADKIKKAFKPYNIGLSVHAPYYTNFANPDPEKIESNIGYVTSSILFANEIESDRIIVHPGSQRDLERIDAISITHKNLHKLKQVLDDSNSEGVYIYLETLGIIRQMGTVEEILDMCMVDKRFIPCLDFGHINTRYLGLLKNDPAQYENILKLCKDSLPENKLNRLHIHFSKIIYGPKGERAHTTFADDTYGPDFEPMIDALLKLNIPAHVICESAGTQDIDSLSMKNYYNSLIR